MACDAASLIATAYANGYAKLSDRDLREAILAAACAGGGGGGGGGVSCGAVDPVAAPATTCGVYVNTVSGQIWWYYNGVWQ